MVVNPNPFYAPNWYWIVGGDATQVYSSAVGNFVPVADATYQAWLATGNKPSRIASTADLADALDSYGLPPPPGSAISDEHKDGLFDDIPKAVKVWSFAVDNRVRALEGQPVRNANQFKNYVKSLM